MADVIEIKAFNAVAAYEREREENRRVWGLLQRAIILHRMEAERRERNGEDATGLRRFIADATV